MRIDDFQLLIEEGKEEKGSFMTNVSKTTLKKMGQQIERPRLPARFLQAALIALGASVFLYLAMYFPLKETYACTMFTQRGLIPYMTTYLAFLGLALLGASFLNLLRELRNFRAIAAVLGDMPHVDMPMVSEIRKKLMN